MTLGDAQVPPGTAHATGANHDLTPGTPRPARVGDTVRTASELDALPVGSAFVDKVGDVGLIDEPGHVRYAQTALLTTSYVVKHYAPLTVLFRPDAPQPATDGDAEARDWAATAKDLFRLILPILTEEEREDAETGALPESLVGRRDGSAAQQGGEIERAARALWIAEQETDESREAAGRYWDTTHFSDNVIPREHYRTQARAALAAARAGEAEGDEHHTMDELYEYRMLYNAHAALGWLAAGIPVVKSWRHSDGEECFGGGWFIVVATLPTGQVSNHYAAEHWGLFDVPEVDLPPEYDGHTPQIAADRLRERLAAQRGGEAVDRGALAQHLFAEWRRAHPGTLTWETFGDRHRQPFYEQADVFLGFLAARGDAAEVEWGVRWPNSHVEKCGAPGTADDYEDESVAEHGGVRVQRTVSAWREVEGGEQRG